MFLGGRDVTVFFLCDMSFLLEGKMAGQDGGFLSRIVMQ